VAGPSARQPCSKLALLHWNCSR